MKICYSKVRKTPERGGRRMRFIKISLCVLMLSALAVMYQTEPIIANSKKEEESVLLIAGKKELKVLNQEQLKVHHYMGNMLLII